DQVPRGHPLIRVEVGEQFGRLRPLERNRRGQAGTVPAQQAGQEPLAEAAVPVVEDEPALVAAQAVVRSAIRSRHRAPRWRISGGYTIAWRNGRIAAMYAFP